jgi:hypothetical protein
VEPNDRILIGGFIVTGNEPKRIVIRGMGPSVKVPGGRLADPTLELRDASGGLIVSNDNWRDSGDRDEIQAAGLAPEDDREAVVVRTLAPGQYTALVAGKDNTSGIALVEVYDRSANSDSVLANISTRGLVQTEDNVLIGGFIAGNQFGNARIMVRGIGPSLRDSVPGALEDPVLELRDGNGGLIASNDNWKDDQQSEIEATGIPPRDDAEAAIVRSMSPALYTAILRGNNDGIGIALVEIYRLRE